MNINLHCDDCFNMLPSMKCASINLVATSPPYAQQRKRHYTGVPETHYVEWMCQWSKFIWDILEPAGSLAIIIRPHHHKGQIADYVLRARLALRDQGWCEAEELIWIKPDGPPLGSVYRPRRSWESILWFAKSSQPYVDLLANGSTSKEIGFSQLRSKKGLQQGYIHHTCPRVKREGIARCRDIVEIPVGTVAKGNPHPAQCPVDLMRWIIRLLCPPQGTVLDPFMGSGTTGAAAIAEKRHFIGIEKDNTYFQYAQQRIEACTKEAEETSET